MDEPVAAFVEAARGFRSAVANEEEGLDQFARRLRNAVARVYLAAARLPRGGSVTSDEIPDMTADRAYSHELEARIGARLGPADTFVDVWDPTERGRTRPIQRSLAQELVEIDEDLARSVSWLEEPRPPDALWHVWFAFEEHWGKHAVDVLRPLHHIARGGVG